MSKMKVLTSLSCIIIATSPVLARPIASEFSLSKRLAQLWRPIYEMNGRPVVPADDAIFTDYHIEIRSTSAPGDSSTSFPTITASSGDPPFASGTGSGTGFGTGTGSPPTTTDVTITLTSTVTEVATSQETASSTQVSSSQPATSSTESFAPTPSNNGFLNGVNIGNWLILEKWMDKGTTFKDQFANAQDQWTFDSIEGSAEALEKHWSTWFTQADVQKIKSWGFNTLRIPIGYWAYDDPATSGVPYKPGADAYLEKAIGWAREAGMKVMVDCHGSPGSQNGQDHSGHSGPVEWQQGNNLQKSIDLLTVMAKKYGSQEYADVVFGLEIVSESRFN